MTTTPDFRILSSQLLAAIQLYTRLSHPASEMSSAEITETLMNAMAAMRTALAAPPPEPPTDDELMALAVTVFDDYFATDKDYARAVLERWGNYPVIPVSSTQVSPPEQP